MLNFTNVALRRGPRLLFEHVSFTVHAGHKVGVTGANGTGKSSLFALIRGELSADAGEVSLPPDAVIAHVAQETAALERPALEYVLDGDRELREQEAELAAAEQAGDGHRGALIHGRLQAIDAYAAPARAARLMHGLGFGADDEQRPVAAFSGGWRVRLNLARALMARSDVLLLDEPTNHLDLDAVLWLEDWLRGYPGTLLLISHDRDFLDRVVGYIAHLENGAVRVYTGNYTDFEAQRAERLAQQQAAHEKQQREVQHMRAFVDRFRAKATKARQAQSRLKALERMERIAPAHVDSPFTFEFREPLALSNPLLALDEASAGYDDAPVLSDMELTLAPGDRLGLLGPNGAGKSTLVKLLAGALPALQGRCERAPQLRVGYFAQHQLEQLHADESPLQHLQQLDPEAREQALRDFIGGFGFRGDAAVEPVAPLSGGEKARLVLALLVYQQPNLLLLDEPTNHLDLEMRYALNRALQGFQGAMVLVSHDRHLLRTVADRFVLVAEGQVQPFDGDLDDYRTWLAERRARADASASTDTREHSAAARRERKRQEADQRRQLQPLRKKIQQLERQVETLTAEKQALETQLADPSLYADEGKGELTELLKEQGRVERELAEAEHQWLEACEALEAVEGGD